VILQHAGKDATKAYSEVHDPSLLERTLPPTSRIGTIDPSSSSFSTAPVVDDNSSAPLPTHPITPHHNDPKPPLHSLLSSYDFENVASKTLNAKTWAFYSSAATDLITLRANKSFFDRIWFRPRVMRDVRHVETTCSIQGVRCSLPVFVAPAALAKMVHPSGELGIAVGCERNGVVYCVSFFRFFFESHISFFLVFLGSLSMFDGGDEQNETKREYIYIFYI
jgi:L-lactate dehydrogenase (cytochrome)